MTTITPQAPKTERRPVPAARIAQAREPLATADTYVPRTPARKVEIGQPLGMGMIGVGGFGWLWASARAGGAFNPLALAMMGLFAAGFALAGGSIKVEQPKAGTAARVFGLAAPAIGIVGGAGAAFAMGLAGWPAVAVIGACFLGGMAIYKATN